MCPIATDRVAWSVCVCVCLPVGHIHEPCKKRLNRSRCGLGADLHGPKESCIRWGRDPPEEGAIFGSCQVHCKALEVSDAVYAAKEIIQTSITARSIK